MFAFGDSLTDIGNDLYSPGAFQPSSQLPYGETFFLKATGRYSDGRLITDFLPATIGLPLLDPYLQKGRDLGFGKAFAVAGATAMDEEWLAHMDIHPSTSYSLDVQMQWFKDYKSNICMQQGFTSTQCTHHMSQALYFFGEIGGNDLNYPLSTGRAVSEVASYIPIIIQKIRSQLHTLIQEGARFIIVEGAMPMGCAPVYIQAASSLFDHDTGSVDELGCVASLNGLSRQHNTRLQQLIQDLQVDYPDVHLLYFDFYQAFTDVLKNAQSEGITNTLNACYSGAFQISSHSASSPPANQELHLCTDPRTYASWDGVHPTQAMYRGVARRLLMTQGFQNPFPNFLTQRCNLQFPSF